MINEVPFLIIHFAATCYMTGIIWFAQIIFYPRLKDIPTDGFIRYHHEYTRTMGFIVGPAMIIELLTGTLISMLLIDANFAAVHLNIFLLFVIWASTFVLQVPLHVKLGRGYDPAIHRRLVQTNWIRTIAWTVRVFILGYFLHRHAGIS